MTRYTLPLLWFIASCGSAPPGALPPADVDPVSTTDQAAVADHEPPASDCRALTSCWSADASLYEVHPQLDVAMLRAFARWGIPAAPRDDCPNRIELADLELNENTLAAAAYEPSAAAFTIVLTYRATPPNVSYACTDSTPVALTGLLTHELGHVLGLDHSSHAEDAMYPIPEDALCDDREPSLFELHTKPELC